MKQMHSYHNLIISVIFVIVNTIIAIDIINDLSFEIALIMRIKNVLSTYLLFSLNHRWTKVICGTQTIGSVFQVKRPFVSGAKLCIIQLMADGNSMEIASFKGMSVVFR